MFKSPIDFAENILLGKHTALFYENAEYARTVSFAFLESGMKNREHCFYFISGGDTDFFRNEFIETIFDENLFHLENFEFVVGDDTSVYSLTKNIINIVKKITQSRERKNEAINN